MEEKELYRWSSVERPFKAKSKEFYSTVTVLAILAGIIFFFIEGLMPVLVIAAILFSVFALSKTPPREIEHIITDQGITIGGDKFAWDELTMFWLSQRASSDILNLITTRRFPRQLMLVLPPQSDTVSKDKIKIALLKYLPLQQLPPSWLDKTTKWVNDKLPLEE